MNTEIIDAVNVDGTLCENTMYADAASKAAIVGDPKLVVDIFFLNFLGFVGLYALNDSRGYMKKYESTEKKLMVKDIGDENHDVSLSIRLCFEAGLLTEALAAPLTKFLALVKQKTIKAADIDDARIRAMVEASHLHVKPMDAQIKQVVSAFMDGGIGVKEYSRQIYDVAKKNTWRDYTLELRELVVKSQYTEYFQKMKAGQPLPAKTPIPAAVKPAPIQPAVVTSTFEAGKKAVAEAFEASQGFGTKFWQLAIQQFGHHHTTMADLPEAITAIPTALIDKLGFKDSDFGLSVSSDVRAAMYDAVIAATVKSGSWNKFEPVGSMSNYKYSDGQKKLLLETALKFPVPATSEAVEQWKHLAMVLRRAFTNDELTSALQPLVKLDADIHNTHFLTVFSAPGKSVHMIDGGMVSTKAATWIRKNGDITSTRLILSTAVTASAFSAMPFDERVLYICKNFTEAGVKKMKNWFSRNVKPWEYVKSADRQLSSILSAFGDDIRQADVLALSRAASSDQSDIVRGIASLVYFHDVNSTKKAAPCPTWLTGYFKNNATSVSTAAKELIGYIMGLPVNTAAEVEAFNSLMGCVWSEGYPFFKPEQTTNLGKTANHGAQWLPYMSNYGVRDVVGVVDSSHDRIVVGADASEECRQWISTFGLSSGVRKVEVAKAVSGKAELAMACVLHTFGAKTLLGVSLDAKAIDEVKAMSREEWAPVIAEAAKADPTLFSRVNGAGIKGAQGDFTPSAVENMRREAATYCANNYDEKTVKSFSGYVFEQGYEILPPLTAAKLTPVLNRYESAKLIMNADEVFPLFFSNSDYGLERGDIRDVFVDISKSFFSSRSPEEKVSVLQALFDKDQNREANRILYHLAIFSFGTSLASMKTGRELYRWASGATTEKVVEWLKAGEQKKTFFIERYKASYPWMESDDIKSTGGNYKVGGDLSVFPYLDLMTAEERKQVVAGISPQYIGAYSFSSLDEWKNDGEAMSDLKASFVATTAGKNQHLRGHYPCIEVLKQGEKFGAIEPGQGSKMVLEMLEAMEAGKEKPVEFINAAEAFSQNSLTSYIGKTAMQKLVPKILSSASERGQDAIAGLAYGKDFTAINPDFIQAVRDNKSERSILNRLKKYVGTAHALKAIKSDPNGVPIDIDPTRVKTFLAYNDVDLEGIVGSTAKKLEDLDDPSTVISSVIPPLQVSEATTPDSVKAAAKALHASNRYNHSPALGLEVKQVLKVNVPGQREKFDAWVSANPDTKIVNLFHGCGTINAAFILRFGFKIIKSSDPSVTGRMLGDGIYFADNINKSMLYMSNAGYIRAAGQTGYVLKCKIALGKKPRDHREGNAENRGLVSNEWAVMSTDQIVIEEAYFGTSRSWAAVEKLVMEAQANYLPSVSTFMFMDGQVPIDDEVCVDFEGLPDFGKHVSVETSAKGPVITIRHDRSVVARNHCFRYGSQLQSDAKLLKSFIALCRNKY